MAIVKLPTPMRVYTNNQTELHIIGDNVREVLNTLTVQFPALRDYIFNDNQGLRPYVTIFVNEVNIKEFNALDTPVIDEDRLMMILSIAGGHTKK